MSQSLKKPIQIFARLKPLPNSSEPFPYGVEKIDTPDGLSEDDILVFNMKTYGQTDEGYYAHRPQENHRFRYSQVFDMNTKQPEIFETICKPVIDGALNGYNGTIFAYGQTGSGKTYTMTGSRHNFQERGIIPRTLSYIFEKFQTMEDGIELQAIYISYLEIYNENGYDLLHPSMAAGKLEDLKKVALLEDSQQQIHLKHLSVNPVTDEDQAMHLFYMGEHHRTIAETPMNEASTRSHCIFTIHIHTREIEGSLVRRSKVHLVDLAGSERISNSNISGQLFNEARHINLALHYLEQVIVALGEANRIHIPYRNSMMTSILRDSLGGNCMTSMIATLSLEPRNIPETLSTCRFSQRVALVTNDATMNAEIDPDLLIAQLKAEVKRLKNIISQQTGVKQMSDESAPLTEEEFQECCSSVQNFLNDPAEEALLSITPDMRLIQKCFQCLKYACTQTQSKIAGAMQVYNKYVNIEEEGTSTATPQNGSSVQDLLSTLDKRDSEIKILTQMLEDARRKLNSFEGPSDPGSGPSPSGTVTGTLRAAESSSSSKKSFLLKNDAAFQRLTEALEKPPYSPPTTTPPSSSSKAKVKEEEKDKPLIDSETLLIEGFNERKRTAWENFLNNYAHKDTVLSARKDVQKYRNLVQDLQDSINKNYNRVELLKLQMTTGVTSEEIELNNSIILEACKEHGKNIVRNERQLVTAVQGVEKAEEKLKTAYSKMVQTFESLFENKGTTTTTTTTTNPDRNNNVDRESIATTTSNNDESPLKAVAAGVFKKSGAESESFLSSSKSKPLPSPRRSKNKRKFQTLEPPLTAVGGRPADLPKSSSRSKSKRKGIANQNDSTTVSAMLNVPQVSVESILGDRIRSHGGQGQGQGQGEVMTTSSRKSPRPLGPELASRSRSREPSSEEEEDPEIGKECPMTGDPVCDREILSFIRKRQAVFRKINEGKNQLISTNGSAPEFRNQNQNVSGIGDMKMQTSKEC